MTYRAEGGGENRQDVLNRIDDLISELTSTYLSQQSNKEVRILLVSHGGLMNNLFDYVLRRQGYSDNDKVHIKNCSLSIFFFQVRDGKLAINTILNNDDSHVN